MTDSYVFYRSFHEGMSELPDEQYGKIARALNEYALNDKEPSLMGVEKIVFTLIKPQLDANKRRREIGPQGGRPQVLNDTDTEQVIALSENGLSQREIAEKIGCSKTTVQNILAKYKENSGHKLVGNWSETGHKLVNNWSETGQEVVSGQKPNVNVNVNDNVNVNENVNVNDKEKDDETLKKHKRFKPPTLDEVRYYCQQVRKNSVDFEKFYDYYEAMEWKDKGGNPVKNWKGKVITWEMADKKMASEKKTEVQKKLENRGGLVVDEYDSEIPF